MMPAVITGDFVEAHDDELALTDDEAVLGATQNTVLRKLLQRVQTRRVTLGELR